MRSYCAFMVVFALWVAAAQRTGSVDLKSLYDRHQWFDLREALPKDRNCHPLYLGAVNAAFNDQKNAEIYFHEVFSREPKSDDAYEAHEWLTYLYLRTGLYSRAVKETESKWAARPDKDKSDDEHGFMAALAQFPDQSSENAYHSRVEYTMGENLAIPVTINNSPAEFIVDTDANISFLSQACAKALGLAIHPSRGKVYGAAGKLVEFQTVTAGTLSIGRSRLRNVAFIVISDEAPVFEKLPVNQRGALGLPVLMALESIRWSVPGKFEVRAPSTVDQNLKPNLCFDGADPVTKLEFQRQALTVLLDTGDEVTEFWPPFATRFASLVTAKGIRTSKSVLGFGGSKRIDEVIIPMLTVGVGGFEATIRPAHILMDTTTPSSSWYGARLGLDTLKQAHQVTIDFKRLAVSLR